MDLITGAAFTFGVLLIGLGLGWFLRRPKAKNAQVHVHSTVENFRAIGELSVFKAITKEIVTSSDHAFGEFGEKYLSWAFTKKKMVMIFEFELDFRYDLKRDDFMIDIVPLHNNTRKAVITMPPCSFDLAIRNVQFYDEQKSKLLPWLLPDLVSGFVDGGFSEEDKNKLLAEAKTHAEQEAHKLVLSLKPDVERSARSTLQALASSFGVQFVEIAFRNEHSQMPAAKMIKTEALKSDADIHIADAGVDIGASSASSTGKPVISVVNSAKQVQHVAVA
jgi:Protein of unknown function (DUF4230)